MPVRILFLFIGLLFVSPARAATPDVIVVGPRKIIRRLRVDLSSQLEERTVVVRSLPKTRRKRARERDLLALARNENASIVVHVDKSGRRGWRVRAIAEDGRRLLNEAIRSRRIDAGRLAESLSPALSQTLIADYPPPKWQPEPPRPVVPPRAPVEVIDEGPNRLKRVVLSGYGRTYAAIESRH